MPNNLNAASPTGVLQKMTFTGFESSLIYPMWAMTYHDGTLERALITDTVNPPLALLQWKLSATLTASALTTLRSFYSSHRGNVKAFYWYNPYEPQVGHQIGSNYDASGVSVQGRRVVRFTNMQWSESTGMCRSNISFELHQVA